MREFWQSLNKFYFTNFVMASALVLSILTMFIVQSKMEFLQDSMVKVESEIAAFEDEIQLLEVEWVYLTRPDRLRSLASRYLKDNGYALASQIKDEGKIEQYYLANYSKIEEDPVIASNDAVSF